MSLTYVLTTLFRGDDIEQTEHVIVQLLRLSRNPRPIIVFNGGTTPRNQTWLETKYPCVKVIELPPPLQWNIREEFHYFDYVSTQLYKYVETELFVKMDRDVCVCSESLDEKLIGFMRGKPDVAAAGTIARCERNIPLDSRHLFDWLPRKVSFAHTETLNGGVEIFRTEPMRKIGVQIEQHGQEIWSNSLQVGEDDLISLTLVGKGYPIIHCPLLLSIGMVDPALFVRKSFDSASLKQLRLQFQSYCIVHGFKPFYLYRPYYRAIQQMLLNDGTEIEIRNSANDKDTFCAEQLGQFPYAIEKLLNHLAQRHDEILELVTKKLHEGATILQVMQDPGVSMASRIALAKVIQEIK